MDLQPDSIKAHRDASFRRSRAVDKHYCRNGVWPTAAVDVAGHVARIPLLGRAGDDTDADYQSRLLGSAKIEVVALAQTGVTLSADDL
jgi:hypothetical protein